MIKVMKIASELNALDNLELQRLTEFLKIKTAESLSNYLSFELQERELLNVEVQESVC